MQLEAIKSADIGHAAYDTSSKLMVLADTITVADRKRSGFDDAATATRLRVQIGYQRIEDHWHQLYEALIAHQNGKLAAQVALV